MGAPPVSGRGHYTFALVLDHGSDEAVENRERVDAEIQFETETVLYVSYAQIRQGFDLVEHVSRMPCHKLSPVICFF